MDFIVKTRDQLPATMTRIAAMDFSHPQVITVKPYRETRSLSANALFHVWVREMAKTFTERGHAITEETLKDALKAKFLGVETYEVPTLEKKGEKRVLERPVPTSCLDRAEFCFFMEQVEAWAHTVGVMLETPKESAYWEYLQEQVA